ncbi:HTH-type transcriptional regulator XynR [Brevundimonas sp. NIBR10]|uniref:IclR family transcriptional regulator n=1 Tax=Brevundimonas sp. NIBR10 TaxID=3015997 RepID=UPI0022F18BB2|nr:IclR family transcriptional regulator C-terminal domain-containing protein [Brevundimonas sp. NIBR10]WGM47254.1 HTH-type transcriptional regulator XynR [Brevundimonas sp. NIBR10]
MARSAAGRALREEASASDGAESATANDAGEKMVIVKPAANAIRILKFLVEAGGPTRSVTISRSLGLNASTCFNILRTLVLEDVVEFDPVAKTYSVGVGLTTLVGNLLTEGQRVAAATPQMRELADRYNITMTLWKRLGPDKIVLVKSVASPANVRIEMAEGQRLPVLMASTGRIMAPHLGWSRKDLKAAFKALRWQTPLTFEDYWEQVEAAEARGWASDQGYFTKGVQTIAAPVFDRAGDVAFSIVGVMLLGQYEDGQLDEIGAALRDAGRRLTNALT